MSRRPGRCYRNCSRQPYTRKKYIHRQPASRIVSFDMGDPSGKFEVEISLVGLEKCQIRHQALEAARIASNRSMQREVGRRNYHLRIRVKINRSHCQCLCSNQHSCVSFLGRRSFSELLRMSCNGVITD